MRNIILYAFLCGAVLTALSSCASSGNDNAAAEPVLLFIPDNKSEEEKAEAEKELAEPDDDVFDLFEDNPDTFVREDSLDYMTAHTGIEDDPDTFAREDLVPMRLREKRAQHLRELRRKQNAPK